MNLWKQLSLHVHKLFSAYFHRHSLIAYENSLTLFHLLVIKLAYTYKCLIKLFNQTWSLPNINQERGTYTPTMLNVTYVLQFTKSYIILRKQRIHKHMKLQSKTNVDNPDAKSNRDP